VELDKDLEVFSDPISPPRSFVHFNLMPAKFTKIHDIQIYYVSNIAAPLFQKPQTLFIIQFGQVFSRSYCSWRFEKCSA
jgi:hypothetical protein